MKISCIIIDDEQHAINVTSHFCQKIPNLEIRETFTDPTAAVAFVDEHGNEIDLVFLDIEMPRFSGIDFLKKYSFRNVILVTAYTDYAVESYQYGVVDYLLKPYSFDRFCIAVNKVFEKKQINNKISTPIEEKPANLYLKLGRNKHVKLLHSEIIYILGASNYSVIGTVTDQIVVPLRLQKYAHLLPIDSFPRVHKSHIIHMDYFESLDGKIIKLKATDRTFFLGPSYKQEFLKILKMKYPSGSDWTSTDTNTNY